MSNYQTKILLSAGNQTMTATLADNSASRELVSLLQKEPITIEMSDYGGFEKVGMLPQSFTTSNSQITTQPGDIMLYQGNNMVIFYGSNSWSYTPLGKIDDATADDLREWLGAGDISLTLSQDASSATGTVVYDNGEPAIVYDLNGNRVPQSPLSPGIYIINGKKTVIN